MITLIQLPQLSSQARFFASSALRQNVIKELESRGMIADLTSRAIRKHVEKPTSVYLGVDPSARSLHVGNLLALIGLLHFRLGGHTGVCLIGGATGSVGDPSGRSSERNALSSEDLAMNTASITKQVTTFLNRGVPFALQRTHKRYPEMMKESASGIKGELKVENNLNWLGKMTLLEFLSGVGKTARISTMLSRESVKSRMDSKSGLSFTEFSYQLLQAFDFLTLHKTQGCTIQLGGSDQLGNILSGIEMIRKDKLETSAEEEVAIELGSDSEQPAYGVTMPLLTTASGEKFGKSAGNAVWLDPTMTTPLEFYQFFLRTTDEEVLRYLKIFSFIRVVEMKGIMEEHEAHRGERFAQKILAAEVTELVHGEQGLRQALAATKLFYSSDLSAINVSEVIGDLDGRPTLSCRGGSSEFTSLIKRLNRIEVIDKPISEILRLSGLVATKTQARLAIEQGNIHLNGIRIPAKSHQRVLQDSDLRVGLLILRIGKNTNLAVLVE